MAFYNAQYFTLGNIASRALSEAILDATSKLSPVHGVRLPSVGSGSLVVEQYVLTNPALNYAGFLLRAVMPTTLHVVIGMRPPVQSAPNSRVAAGAFGYAAPMAAR
jgi:ABC-2 type transport system permease protein